MSRVETLVQNGVEPIVVFDGGRLPMKADEEAQRRTSRRDNKEKGLAHLASGNVAAAEEAFQKAINITSAMVKTVIEALRDQGIQSLVAPYEADAQMAYLALTGEVHAVITEDSDLLVYGCPRVLFKMDRTGSGEEICIQDLPQCTGNGISFVGFSHEMFVHMCILSGCDFLDSPPNIGTKKAFALLKKHLDFVRACRSLRFTGASIAHDYEKNFQKCLWVFRHQRVFCPKSKTLVHVRPLPPGGIGAANVDVMAAIPCPLLGDSGLDFLGPLMDDDVAQGIAEGRLDATTKEPFDLAEIYRGCPSRLVPRGVAAFLEGSRPSGLSSHPDEPQHQSGGGGASARGSGWVSFGQLGSKGSHQQLSSQQPSSQQPSFQHPSSGKSKTDKSENKNHKIEKFFKPISAISKPFVPPARLNEGEMFPMANVGSKKRLGMQGPSIGVDRKCEPFFFQPRQAHSALDSANDLSITLTDELQEEKENNLTSAVGWTDFQFEVQDKSRRPMAALPAGNNFWASKKMSPLPSRAPHNSLILEDDLVIPSSHTGSRRKRSRDKGEGFGSAMRNEGDIVGGLLARVRSSLSPIFADLVPSSSRKIAQPFSVYACQKEERKVQGSAEQGFHDLSHLDDFSHVAHKVISKAATMTHRLASFEEENEDPFEIRQSLSL